MESIFQGTIYEPYDFFGDYTHALVVHVNLIPELSPALQEKKPGREEMQQLSRDAEQYFWTALPETVCKAALPAGSFLVLALGYTLDSSFSLRDENNLMEELTGDLKQALADIRSSLGLELSLSVSSLHPNTMNVYDAMQEAMAIAENYKFWNNPEPVMLYRNFQNGLSAEARERKERLEDIWTANMQTRNYEAAEETLSEILDLRASASATVISLLKELQNRMTYAIFQLCDVTDPPMHIADQLLSLVEKIRGAKSLQELHDNIHTIYMGLIYVRDASDKQNTWSWTGQICTYVQNNYADPALNISMISSHFGLNASYLSHTFHGQTGVKLLDYIHITRMEHVKHLLTDTGLNLSEIARQTGYYDRATMSRVFCRYTGVTPTAYRKKNI